jgi:nucleotide-binding universal stress UspA family protein
MALGSASKDEIEDYVAHEKGRAAQELAVFLRDVNFTPARQLLKVSQVSAAQTICATAQELSADLVVLGTQGRTGLAKFLLGSVVEEVLGRAATDVIAVPPRQ